MREGSNHTSDEPLGPDTAVEPHAGVEELAQAADALFCVMRRARTSAGQAGTGLSVSQLALLGPLAADTELPVGRLAAVAGVSVPTATRMLQQLEARGSVARRRSPADERQVLIRLTDDGVRQLAAVRSRLRDRQVRGLSRFPPEERAQLARQLRRLADVIAELDR